jgi:hypothetical protein
LTPQAAQDIAVVCIGKPQEGHDDDSNFLAIISNISTQNRKVKKNLEFFKNILILFDFSKRDTKPDLGDLRQKCQKIIIKLKFFFGPPGFRAVISLLISGFMPNLSRPWNE